MAGPYRPQRRAGRAAGGEPVVDDDRRAARHLERGPAAAVARHARVDLRARPRDRGLELLVADLQRAYGMLVEHANVALGDGADTVLGVAGRADLAHDEHVERSRSARATSKATGTPPRASPSTTASSAPSSATAAAS